ncbi:MAG: TPMT family class I SAM-dependent methyltransferase [Chitinophagales bacterium]|nr:TPMT family class I SAM-dependent methyltransferase [Chitinophagales bacterium]MDW8428504.1 methyltransferase domain-containing protein [Chitinophagales bacterium]
MDPRSAAYWQQRWLEGAIGWDLGEVSPPLREFFDQIAPTTLRVLIPGAGNGYEAEYLWKKGFQNVWVLDFAEAALESFKRRVPDFPHAQVICEDFFNHHGQYDLIIEHTFFCALPPSFRHDYAKHMNRLLVPGGRLVGLLFNDHLCGASGPPFGGTDQEYIELFHPYFETVCMQPALNSAAPRQGRELFFILRKPAT